MVIIHYDFYSALLHLQEWHSLISQIFLHFLAHSCTRAIIFNRFQFSNKNSRHFFYLRTKLGLKPYHMMNLFETEGHFEVWLKYMQNPRNASEVIELLASSGFNATTDMPACHIHKELFQHYPNAKVILSVRRNGDVSFIIFQQSNYHLRYGQNQFAAPLVVTCRCSGGLRFHGRNSCKTFCISTNGCGETLVFRCLIL